MKLLGIQIAGGYSSEARVFATLLGNRDDRYDALVIHQEGPTDPESPKRFEADSKAKLARLDFGWRPSPPGGHATLAKVTQFARLKRVIPQAIRIAREYEPDVIYSNQQHWDCYAATAIARALGKPQVMHLHYIIGPWLRRQPVERLLTCEHVVVVSDFIREVALKHGVPAERVTTVRNAMRIMPAQPEGTREAVRSELGVPADAPFVGIVARLDKGKGQDDTLAAFAEVSKRFPDARLAIVGDGVERAALEDQARALGLNERAIFTGRRADVPRILAALDIFCHPSRQDPCPLAVLEASSAGLPVIAYAEGGTVEVVVDGETGILALPGDVPALARAMGALMEDPTLARRMGAAGRERIARDFTPAAAGAQFASLMQRVAGI